MSFILIPQYRLHTHTKSRVSFACFISALFFCFCFCFVSALVELIDWWLIMIIFITIYTTLQSIYKSIYFTWLLKSSSFRQNDDFVCLWNGNHSFIHLVMIFRIFSFDTWYAICWPFWASKKKLNLISILPFFFWNIGNNNEKKTEKNPSDQCSSSSSSSIR